MSTIELGDEPWIVSLDSCGRANLPIVGAKAANLGTLMRHGFPVPAGFVITTRVYARAARASFEIPPEIEALVLTAHAELVSGSAERCVIRSSATAEDMRDASFAGLYDTYYDVDSINLLEGVRGCWASARASRVFDYLTDRGIDRHAVEMAVIVQKQVDARSAGVAFTVNPTTSHGHEIVVESVWGKGAVLADGRSDPDRYLVRKSDLSVRSRRLGRKQFKLSSKTARSSLVAVDARERASESLDDATLQVICCLALQAEEHFGEPQDLEWAAGAHGVFVLQSRPVTGLLPIAPESVDGPYVAFKPALENFTEPLTPLTADLLASVPVPGVRIIKGWLYWDVAFLRRLLPLRLRDSELVDLLSLRAVDGRGYRVAWSKLPFLMVVLFAAYLLFGVLLARTRNAPDGFMEGFRRRTDELARDPTASALDVARKLFLPRRILEPVGLQVLLINFSAARMLFAIAALKWCLRRWAPELGEAALSQLISGSTGVLSADMGRAIGKLADVARQNPSVERIIQSVSADGVVQRLRRTQAASEFLEELQSFLVIYGHRGLKELELASPRFGEQPAPIIAMVRSSLNAGAAATASAVEQQRGCLRARLAERVGPLKRFVIDHLSRRARYFNKLRENSRFYHVLGFTLLRRKVLEVADALVARGELRRAEDVFFLQLEEVECLRQGSLTAAEAARRIHRRRVEHTRLARVGPPRTLGIDAPRSGRDLGNCLVGHGASPGVWEAKARVMFDAADAAELEPGEILVTPYSDPGWTPLFLIAGAAVVEVGSYLSHAASVAREYAMPCVVDVNECTTRIRTGYRLRVDGSEGRVWILPDAEPR